MSDNVEAISCYTSSDAKDNGNNNKNIHAVKCKPTNKK